ncbi:Hypp2194 [Xyrichtys novacula]|uniref:Hypp2194 n=1 Tax=Xyrichtys novacula TaxID=13765 RepID=A0AAV1FGL0_XYRNO|nr:Hypp2194 [Xyrichtys novacula]
MCSKTPKKEARIDVPGINPLDFVRIANAVNAKFIKVSQSLEPLDLSALPSFLPSPPLPTIPVWEVYNRLSSIDCHKSPGPDMIPPKILKEFACEISIPLCDIINCSFDEGVVPRQWKEATVVPIPKSSPCNKDELRPISLTAQLSKICEHFAGNWILNDIMPNLDPMQFGSRQNRSTTHNLVSLMDFMYRTSDVSDSVCTVITTDFAKAFDAVDHTVAVQCLLDLGVRPSLIPWICSFMTDRQQKVRYQGHLSDWEYPTCGVAQGTVLGPIVFLALINSALQDGPHHWKYVDDMTIAQSWSPKVPCTLQQTLNGLDTWVNEHKMKLNPSKCKVVHVTGMRQKTALPTLSVNQNILEVCDTVKVLGVTIQADLKWNSQVDYMLTSANRKLFVLCRLKKFGVKDPELNPEFKNGRAESFWASGI